MTDVMARASGLSLGLSMLSGVQELKRFERAAGSLLTRSLFAPCLLEPSYEFLLSLPDDW